MKDTLAKYLSYWLPNRVVMWTLIRAYAYTTVHSQPNKTPDEIGFSDMLRSWENKTNYAVDDKGRTPDARRR